MLQLLLFRAIYKSRLRRLRVVSEGYFVGFAHEITLTHHSKKVRLRTSMREKQSCFDI